MSFGPVTWNRKECSMADNRTPNEKERSDPYNPGNQAGKTAGVIKKPESDPESDKNKPDPENDRQAQKR